jgi:glycosyltransferase involved in cell wall biosynthesis
MNAPLVSVVMGVRNGGAALLESINSILEQRGVEFEFIIIDDGSTDDTESVLSDVCANDSRVKLIKRKPSGLTISLIEGCKAANGKYIARQDAHDYSLPNRLSNQVATLEANPDASMSSSHVKFITQERATVFTKLNTDSIVNDGLSGIIHGSTMFRKDSYFKVGGYRHQFYYAQDVDLWSRLVEVGEHIVIPEVLYENCLYPGSISGSKRKEQIALHKLITKATRARRSGADESIWLNKAFIFSNKCRKNTAHKGDNSNGAYFIGSCLARSNPLLAKKYFDMSIKSNPFNLRARLKTLGIK